MIKTAQRTEVQTLPKTPTGITGLDEITGGGLPTGRPTLVAGGAGCGKTMLALVRGSMPCSAARACIAAAACS